MAQAKRKAVSYPLYDTSVFDELKAELRTWNIESVADKARVAPSTIYFWLDGTTWQPRLSTVVKVAQVIGYRVALVRVKGKPTLRRVK